MALSKGTGHQTWHYRFAFLPHIRRKSEFPEIVITFQQKKKKKEKVEHILLRKSCYIKPLSLVRLLFREIFQIN